MLKKFFIFILLAFVSSCYNVETSTRFSDDIRFGASKSQPIYPSFKNNRNSPYYFILNKDSNENFVKMTVRWVNKNRATSLFDGEHSSLKFFIDKLKIYTYYPATKSKVASFDINSDTHEEEIVYNIPLEEFKEIAYAKEGVIELTGRSKVITSYLNKYHTRKGFVNFYESSY